jgi:hypothetical protein
MKKDKDNPKDVIDEMLEDICGRAGVLNCMLMRRLKKFLHTG